jgi:hypothetical protein
LRKPEASQLLIPLPENRLMKGLRGQVSAPEALSVRDLIHDHSCSVTGDSLKVALKAQFRPGGSAIAMFYTIFFKVLILLGLFFDVLQLKPAENCKIQQLGKLLLCH